MAKKRKNPFDLPLGNNGLYDKEEEHDTMPLEGLDIKTIAPLLSEFADEDGIMLITMMAHIVESGVTPEMYSSFHEAWSHLNPMTGIKAKTRRKESRQPCKVKSQSDPDYTLLLKIQMKGVTKPPMWREVEVPANRTFLDLQGIIQCVVGLDNYHLWQFNERAYDDMVQIGIESTDEFSPGLEYVTDDAATTPITQYLSTEGDKLEYVYDFGDDWIFIVSVKKILNKKSDHPVCTAFKSELNAIEDSGGPWNYERIRGEFEDWSSYTKKRRKEMAEEYGFESAEEYYEFMKDSVFDIDYVNERLAHL